MADQDNLLGARALAALDGAPDGCALSTEDGKLVYANARFWAMVGSVARAPGFRMTALFAADGPRLAHLDSDPASPCDIEAEMAFGDGAGMPVRVRGDVLRGASGTFAVTWLQDLSEQRAKEASLSEARLAADRAVQDLTITWFEDITVRKEAEAQLRVAKEVSERALHDLREAQAHLVEAEKMASLGGLVAGVAHEINTPVGTALTATSHLNDRTAHLRAAVETGSLRRADLAAYLETATETTALLLVNLSRAARLVEGFKQVSTDRASEESRSFDLGAYIEEVLVSVGPRLRRTAHRIAVNCPPGIVIESYPGPIAQVITNLVMNSLTHAFAEGTAGTLSIDVEMEAPDVVRITYADDGRGIPAEHQERVFDPFFTTRRGAGGSGLGLHVVFQIVTQTLRGRIELQSQPGAGAKFVMRLPLQANG